MKILIVGATGMVRQNVLREWLLVANVEEVVVLVGSPMNRQHAKLKQLVVSDLFNAEEILRSM